jgi:hypothetical protein
MNDPAGDSDVGDKLNIGLKQDGAGLLEDLEVEFTETIGSGQSGKILDLDLFRIGVAIGIRLCSSLEDIKSKQDFSEKVDGRSWVSSSLSRGDAGVLLELIQDKYESSTPYRLMEQLAYIGLLEIKERGFSRLMEDLHSV